MSFKDLANLLDTTLELPINGKTYVIPSPSAETGLMVQQFTGVVARVNAGLDVDEHAAASLQLDDNQEADFYSRLMGDAFAEMKADKLAWEYIKHAGATCVLWVLQDRKAAEDFWNNGGRPAPKAPQDRKPKAKRK